MYQYSTLCVCVFWLQEARGEVTDRCLILEEWMVNAILDSLLGGYAFRIRDGKVSHAQDMRLVDDADGDGKQSGTTGTNKKQGMEFL